MGSAKKSARTLYQVAARQQGFFTAKQAKAAGYQDSVHGYHLGNGDWEKAFRGIYRLVQFPPSPWPDLIIWSLWSRGRDDLPQGVYSHQTALQIHALASRRKGPLHMTVPLTFRKGSALPKHVVLHFGRLGRKEVETREGFRVTTPARALADAGNQRPPDPFRETAMAKAEPSRPKDAPPMSRPPALTPAERRDWAVW